MPQHASSRPEPPRTPDHGHPLPPRTGRRLRGDGRSAAATRTTRRSARSSASSKARDSCGTKNRAALRVLSGGPAPQRPPLCAPPPRGHVLRRVHRAARQRAGRRRGQKISERRTQPDRRARRQREERRCPMTAFLFEAVVRASILVLAGLLAASCPVRDRRRSVTGCSRPRSSARGPRCRCRWRCRVGWRTSLGADAPCREPDSGNTQRCRRSDVPCVGSGCRRNSRPRCAPRARRFDARFAAGLLACGGCGYLGRVWSGAALLLGLAAAAARWRPAPAKWSGRTGHSTLEE